MIAPIFCRIAMRSMISGSIAALRSSVMPLGAHRREQHLLGGTDARVRQVHVGARAGRCGAVSRSPSWRFSTTAPNCAQHVEVVVDRALADAAAAEVGDERLAEPVQQRPAEQDRDPATSRRACRCRRCAPARRCVGSSTQLAVAVGGVDEHAVQLEQPADDLDVGDLGHVAQPARLLGEQRGHHRLGDEVLGAPDLDVADERARRRRRRGWRSWAPAKHRRRATATAGPSPPRGVAA